LGKDLVERKLMLLDRQGHLRFAVVELQVENDYDIEARPLLTPGLPEEDLAAARKAGKVSLPEVGALMAL
jgi:hypothetical protein